MINNAEQSCLTVRAAPSGNYCHYLKHGFHTLKISTWAVEHCLQGCKSCISASNLFLALCSVAGRSFPQGPMLRRSFYTWWICDAAEGTRDVCSSLMSTKTPASGLCAGFFQETHFQALYMYFDSQSLHACAVALYICQTKTSVDCEYTLHWRKDTVVYMSEAPVVML